MESPSPSTTDKIYCFVAAFLKAYGYPPTVREIRDGLLLKSTSIVCKHLKELEKQGLIEREKNQSRAIRLITGC